ncbi:tetratricopeptide repeat protein [Magnetospirillum sp. UT-4]|uniref:tetratricopeptide repeat protein n=1 Tax=Magnetospirillum sp. UT-4 TaxID=2681467 RepID=UPI0020C1D8DD|nr:tetratricopeptide repeat protein [Magnetospirillum sp. UT-4]
MGSSINDNPQMEAGRALAAGSRAWSEGRLGQAAADFARAALLSPAMPLAHGNLGVALRKLGRVDAAIVCYRRALSLTPDEPALHSNLGNALRERGELTEAEEHLRRAVAANPTAQFRYNLALLLRDRRRHAEAREILSALLAEAPDNPDYAWDKALSDLYLLDFGAGFAGYEARWRLARAQARELPGPRWLPDTDITGKRVLILAEQGFGDALQFARFLPMAAARCAELTVECLPELLDLFAAIPGIARVIPKGAPPPPHDLWAPIMSLAWLFRVTPASIPAQIPYLHPPGQERRLPRPPGTQLNIGLIWAGKTTPRDRSWPLVELMPLFDDVRAAFWSLQMGERSADLRSTGADTLVRDLAPAISSFADTAWLMGQMDLIITIDTSAAHLAGALGRPTWMLLRYVSDWRWLDEPETSAWYPTLRLFRQPDPFDFATPVQRMKAVLAEELQRAAGWRPGA